MALSPPEEKWKQRGICGEKVEPRQNCASGRRSPEGEPYLYPGHRQPRMNTHVISSRKLERLVCTNDVLQFFFPCEGRPERGTVTGGQPMFCR